MTRFRVGLAVGLLFLLGLARADVRLVGAAADTLPARLSNSDFWLLSQQFSEPDGYFRSDNLLSNEIYYPDVIADLVRRTRRDGVYLGVGPEQNFNYIVAIRPKMVFITDVRRGNLHTQLMYKALFELSADRADFVSRLFTKKRPDNLSPALTGGQLMEAYWNVETQPDEVYKRNLQAIKDHLTKTRQLPLSETDLGGIEYVYYNFYWFGPAITYNSSSGGMGGGGGGNAVTYAGLMSAADRAGVNLSYLASEESYRVMRDLEQRNMLVPVVGNFGGSRALRSIGAYLRGHGATVAAFYLSNVEQYLGQDGLMNAFCANVLAMPLDEQSTFIRSSRGGGFGAGGLVNSLAPMLAGRPAGGCGEAMAGSGR